jgi:hypothetical protein
MAGRRTGHMDMIRRALMVMAALALVVATSGIAQAQEPAQPAAQEEAADDTKAESTTAEGELVSVDTDAKTLKIKGSDGAELQFSYTDATEISGAKDDAAGLATEAGSMVSVTFTEEGDTKTATKIEVKAKE